MYRARRRWSFVQIKQKSRKRTSFPRMYTYLKFLIYFRYPFAALFTNFYFISTSCYIICENYTKFEFSRQFGVIVVVNLLVHTITIHKFTCIYKCTHTQRKSMSKQIYYYTKYTHTFSIRKCKLQCANALERLSTLDNSYTINCHINQVDRT